MRRVLCFLAFMLLVESGSYAQGVATEPPDTAGLIQRILNGEERSGAVHAVYRASTGQEFAVGYNRRSGAWYHATHFSQGGTERDRFMGRDEAGVFFGGEAKPNSGQPQMSSGIEHVAVLDAFFPTLLLEAVVESAEIERHEFGDGQPGWIVRIGLVQGSRAQSLDSFSAAQLESMGGEAAVVKQVRLYVSSDSELRRLEIQDGPALDLTSAECSRPGFQILDTPFPWLQDYRLVECRWSDDRQEGFSIASVEAMAVKRRLADGPLRTPIPSSHPDAPQPEPLRTAPAGFFGSSLRTGVLLAGATLVIIALLAWLRRRGTI